MLSPRCNMPRVDPIVTADTLGREIRFIRSCYDGLDMFPADELQKLLPPASVQLTHHIIQQQYRIFARLGADELKL